MGQVTSTSANGVFASGGTNVNVIATSVTAVGNGIIANAGDTANVKVGQVTTTGGVGATGIAASGTDVSVIAGDVTTTGDGIFATALESITINTGRINAPGAPSRGIVALGGTSVNVTSAGVTANGNGVVATSATGLADVRLSGATNSAAGSGTVITGDSARLTLTGGSLNGAINGATIISGTTTTVNNSGRITGGVAAIDATAGGTVTINNLAGGTIASPILLGAGDDRVNNSGTFEANANSDFGAGVDVFNNTGTLAVLPGALAPGAVALTGLTTFNNTGGLIDLRNGHTGDTLGLPGNYVGSDNARLAIDIRGLTPASIDLVTIGGSATGTTAVTVNRLDSPAVLSTATGTVFVDAGAGSTSGAFAIAPASQVDGLIQYGVVYNPTLNTYALVSAPSAAAYRTSLFADGVRNLWLQSGDAWSAHMRELRDNIAANGPGGAGGRFWFQGFGQTERRRNANTFSFNGIMTPVDLSYDQDYYGFQMGADLGAPVGDEGGFNFGITGGYQNSTMSFANTADGIKFNAVNGGVYASFTSGIFFVNALGKYDYYWGENVSPAGNYRADVNGSVWGAKAEAGLRFGQDFFIEPAASISWTNSDFDSISVPSGDFAINDADGVRGKAGARIGYVTQAGVAKLTVYGGANYVHEFRGRDDVVFTSGGQTVAFRSPYNNDYVEGTLGVNIGSEAGKISGFFEGHYADGRDYDGFGARGGMRVRF